MMILKHIKNLPILAIYYHPLQYIFAFVITLISLLIMLFEPASGDWFRYQSIEINQGEWWRLLTANFCHSNWNHWLLNIAGLWLMEVFYQPVLSQKLRASLLLFCMVFSVFLMHLIMNIHWYVGLSGALHGYLIGGALLSWKQAKLLNAMIILLTTSKLVAELLWPINTATEKLINANVLEEIHSFGAISSVVFFIGLYFLKQKKSVFHR